MKTTDDPLLLHAREEMRRAGLYDTDADYGGALAPKIEELVESFSGQGHSGASAFVVIGLLKKLLSFEPLSPLTGEDDEWTEVANGIWQNRRCGRIFKERDGVAYDIEGRIFVEPDGGHYVSGESRVEVSFPYTPMREYVNVPAEEVPDE
jgi:hypothetical protein